MDWAFQLVPWVVFIPLGGMLVNFLVGRRLGDRGAGVVASLAAGLTFVVAVLLALAVSANPEEAVNVPLLNWIHIGDLQVDWSFRVDPLSVVMMLVVSGVGTLIHIYATGYMYFDVRHNEDPGRYPRFFIFFNLFILAMMLLVSASNYLMLFVGWEGVGLCSYLLIGFWFEKGEAGLGNARAAKKAFVVNRIGDFGLLIALFLIFWNFHSFDFDAVFSMVPGLAAAAPGVLLAITLFMLLGVTGKSAQLPLYVWLPDAMAGPTPVSALIHAATMVTAGVYLIARSNPIFLSAPAAQQAVTWVGALTALFAATIAVGQYDIKRVLAYSTISQLGFMVAAVGMTAYTAGMFHLITHAFFKALLFLAAGSVIQGVERGQEHLHGHHPPEGAVLDPQDMRNMGGLQGRMPWTFRVYLVGALALAGIAPLAGFFSKDEIVAAAGETSPYIFIILILAAFLTAFYMGRQVFMVFFGKARSEPAEQATESRAIVTVPLIILAVLAFFGGLLNFPGWHSLEHWLDPVLEGGLTTEFSWLTAGISLLVALLGIFVSWLIYSRRSFRLDSPDPLARSLGGVFTAMQNAWGVDQAYQAIIVRPYQRFAEMLASPVDLGFIDGIVNGTGELVQSVANVLRRLQTGYVRSYVLMMLFGVVAMFLYLALR